MLLCGYVRKVRRPTLFVHSLGILVTERIQNLAASAGLPAASTTATLRMLAVSCRSCADGPALFLQGVRSLCIGFCRAKPSLIYAHRAAPQIPELGKST